MHENRPQSWDVGEQLTNREQEILVTSRERLSLSGETVFALHGLTFPTHEAPEDAMTYPL